MNGGLILSYQCFSYYGGLFLVPMLLIVLCLGACNSPPTPEPTTIYCVAEEMFDLENYVAQFEASYPEVRVHVSYRQQIPDDWPKHFDAALMTHTPHASTDLLLDLVPLVESDSQFDVDDYSPGALAAGYMDGRLVAIPIGLEFNVLVYDPRQLTEANVSLPMPGWTWKDLMNVARAVGRHQASMGTGAVFVDNGERNVLLLNWLQEQVPFYEENVDGRLIPVLDRLEIQSAVSDACNAMSDLTVAIDPQSYSHMDYRPLVYLQDGEAAMVTYSLARFGRRHSQYPDLAVSAFPQPNRYGDDDLTAFGALAVSRGTAHPQAVWQWVRFLSRQNLLSRIIGGYSLPARKSVAEDLGVWETLDTETAQIINTILAGQRGSEIEQSQELLGTIQGHLMDALFGVCNLAADSSTALAKAQQEAMFSVSTWYAERDETLKPFSVALPPTLDETGELSEIIEFLVLDSNEQAYLAATQEFEAAHPGWSIQLTTLGEGWAGDCVSAQVSNYDATMFLNLRPALLPIASISELEPSLTDKSFLPQAIEAVSWHGHLLGIPTAIRPLVLYYDPEVFAQLGLAPPTSDWTVANVLDAAEKIVAANPMWLGYAPHTGAEVRFVLEQQGIRLFGDGAYPQPRFTDPAVLCAIKRLRALQGGQQMLSFSPAAMELPIDGEFCLGGPRMLAVALRPYPDTRWPMQIHMSGVFQQSTQVQMAWEWVTFLTEQGGLHNTSALPAIQAETESEVTRQVLDADLHAAYLTALERDTALPEREATVVEDVALWWFEQSLLNVNAGGLEPALEQAQAQTEQFVDCVATAGRVDDVQTLAMCARQVDPEHWLARITAANASSEK